MLYFYIKQKSLKLDVNLLDYFQDLFNIIKKLKLGQ
jgi:hypothetical protein